MTGTNVFSLLGKLAIDGVEETKKALNDVANEGEQAKTKLNVSFQDIGTKAGEMGKKMALGLAGFATAAVAGVEATREFRQDYGKLETTFQITNQQAGAAKETFTTLFGVLGEDDTAIETANHLAMMTNNEKDLSQWTDVLTGVYATFGDSLPLEGLAEAANETARVGQVTGPLADALNWAGVSEEEFNKKLLECTSTQEREKLIRETLNGLYGEASTTYKNINGDVIANNEAQAEMNMKLADATAKLEPLITQGKLFLAEVLQKLSPALTWIAENINVLAPIVLGFISALFALNIASKIAAIIPILRMLNTTLLTNPIVLIITAIIAAVILLIANWDTVKEAAVKLWDKLKEVFEGIKTVVSVVWNAIKTIITTVWNVIKSVVSTVVNAVKKVIEVVFNAIKAYITTVLNIYKTIFTTAWNIIKTVVTTVVNAIKTVVTKVFNAIKTVVSTIFNGVKTVVSKVWNGISSVISNVVNKIRNTVVNVFTTIKNKISSIFNGIKSIISTIWNGVIGIIKAPINGIIGLINGFIKGLNKIKVPDWVPAVGGKGINIPLIPKLAQGGILEKGQIGLLEGNGAEAVVPLHNNKKWISKVAEDMGTAISINGNNNEMKDKLDRLINLLTNYLPVISEKQVVLSTGELVGAMVNPMDKALAEKSEDRRRGR